MIKPHTLDAKSLFGDSAIRQKSQAFLISDILLSQPKTAELAKLTFLAESVSSVGFSARRAHGVKQEACQNLANREFTADHSIRTSESLTNHSKLRLQGK